MKQLILHHYPVSPFAEKVRTLLGFKGLPWKSVLVPIMMPEPAAIKNPAALETDGLAPGEAVQVAPVDYALDPVKGELMYCTAEEIVVRRTDPRAGTVVVHFPRFGYQLQRAA